MGCGASRRFDRSGRSGRTGGYRLWRHPKKKVRSPLIPALAAKSGSPFAMPASQRIMALRGIGWVSLTPQHGSGAVFAEEKGICRGEKLVVFVQRRTRCKPIPLRKGGQGGWGLRRAGKTVMLGTASPSGGSLACPLRAPTSHTFYPPENAKSPFSCWRADDFFLNG